MSITYAGVDLHKRSIWIKVSQNGKTWNAKIEAKPESAKKFFSQLIPAKVALEATSNWQWLTDILQDIGIDVKLANPLKMKTFSRIKTDEKDASLLLMLLESDIIPCVNITRKELRELKDILNMKVCISKMRAQTKNRIHSILAKEGFNINSLNKRTIKFIRENIKSFVMEGYINLLEFFDKQDNEISRKLKEASEKYPEARILKSIPGIGDFSALVILCEIGDIRRFPSPKHLVSYAGLCPSVYASGGKTRHGKITKQGSKLLRWVMVQVAQVAKMRDENFSFWYNERARRIGGKKACIALARKILSIVWVLLTRGERYEPRAKPDINLGQRS